MAEEKDLSGQENSQPDVEVQAKDMGWKPKEEYEGEEGKWVEAKEFVERKPIYERIHKLEQNNKRLQQTVSEVSDHIQKAEKAAYGKAIKDLEAEKRYAVRSSDNEKVKDINNEIKDLRQKEKSAKPSVDTGKQILLQFVKENQGWWENEEMQDYAVSRHNRILAKGDVSMEESLNKVLDDVKSRFPEHESFSNGSRSRPSSVESGRRSSSGTKRRYSPADLNAHQKEIGERWVRTGALKNLQQYVDELVKVGDLE